MFVPSGRADGIGEAKVRLVNYYDFPTGMHIGGRNADRTDLLSEKRYAQVAGDHRTAVRDEVIARIDTIAELGGKCVVGPDFFKQDDSVSRMRGKSADNLFFVHNFAPFCGVDDLKNVFRCL